MFFPSVFLNGLVLKLLFIGVNVWINGPTNDLLNYIRTAGTCSVIICYSHNWRVSELHKIWDAQIIAVAIQWTYCMRTCVIIELSTYVLCIVGSRVSSRE